MSALWLPVVAVGAVAVVSRWVGGSLLTPTAFLPTYWFALLAIAVLLNGQAPVHPVGLWVIVSIVTAFCCGGLLFDASVRRAQVDRIGERAASPSPLELAGRLRWFTALFTAVAATGVVALVVTGIERFGLTFSPDALLRLGGRYSLARYTLQQGPPPSVAAGSRSEVRTPPSPRAVVVVHLYGQCADLDPVLDVCGEHGIAVVEDAAEALGATYRGRPAGTLGRVGIYSFNGNKIITTSGGGMLVSEDAVLVERARKLATQARESGAEYEHRKIGYNYRLSNVLAAIGRGQLELLASHVESCRRNFDHYVEALADLPGVAFQPEASWGRPTRWLSALTFDPATFGADREAVRSALAAENIEARPLWKPMHQQPAFEGCELVGGSVADDLFQRGLCLPSGSRLADTDLERVCDTVRAVAAHS